MNNTTNPKNFTLRDYNTLRQPLKQPEYGRLVMQMVAHALTIENRALRQKYSERIIRIMTNMNPQMKNVPNFKVRLWEHLAFMSDYKLDIDYPCDITPKEEAGTLKRLSYPGNKIHYRHYGRLIEQLMEKLEKAPESLNKAPYIKSAGEKMKRSLSEWKGDSADNARVARDIEVYTHGKIESGQTIEILGKSNKNQHSKNKKGRK